MYPYDYAVDEFFVNLKNTTIQKLMLFEVMNFKQLDLGEDKFYPIHSSLLKLIMSQCYVEKIIGISNTSL